MIRFCIPIRVLACALALESSVGCASLTPPFDKMKDQAMTIYRLQNYEVPAQAQTPAAAGGLQLPPQIQQWIQAGASLLPPGLLPPGLVAGATAPAPPPAEAPRFHSFRILDYQPINDPSIDHDIVDVFGHSTNFQSATSNCMFAEFGFALAQPNAPTADVLVSLSCDQVQALTSRGLMPKRASHPTPRRRLPRLRSEPSKAGSPGSAATR